jgi:hypothetical protein
MNFPGTGHKHQTLIHSRQNCTACTQEGTVLEYVYLDFQILLTLDEHIHIRNSSQPQTLDHVEELVHVENLPAGY